MEKDIQLISLEETDDQVYEEITRLIFIKTGIQSSVHLSKGVSLRSEADEKIVIPGFLCLLSQDDLYSFSWVKQSSIDANESQLYLDIAKRTKNSIILDR